MAIEETGEVYSPTESGGSPAVSGRMPVSGASSARGIFDRITAVKEFNILVALVLLCAFLSTQSDVFFTQANLLGVARAISITAIVAIGQTMVIVTGGIDLSVGSVVALSGITTGMLLGEGWPTAAAMVAGVLSGSLVGLANGLLITVVGLPPFIATLGTLSIVRGLVYVVTEARPVTIEREGNDLLIKLGQGYVGEVPIPVIILAVITVIATVFLSQSTLGRYIYAVGGNQEAARLAGINVDLVKIVAYVLCSTLAGFAGQILMSRLVSAQPSAAIGFELPVIAAAIIGGTSLMGGEGTVLGTVLGAAIIGVIENGLVLLGVNLYAQPAVIGTVILLAVSLDILQKRRRMRTGGVRRALSIGGLRTG
jgi:ribose transport system permease protein